MNRPNAYDEWDVKVTMVLLVKLCNCIHGVIQADSTQNFSSEGSFVSG